MVYLKGAELPDIDVRSSKSCYLSMEEVFLGQGCLSTVGDSFSMTDAQLFESPASSTASTLWAFRGIVQEQTLDRGVLNLLHKDRAGALSFSLQRAFRN